jgi:hypothetical protein
MEKKTTLNLIINKQHKLLEEQSKLIERIFSPEVYSLNIITVPPEGWTKQEQFEIMKNIEGVALFISPIPMMIKELSMDTMTNQHLLPIPSGSKVTGTFIMCNDTREKVELPNGKIIHKLSETGWYIA